jgi:hypothetical protein
LGFIGDLNYSMGSDPDTARKRSRGHFAVNASDGDLGKCEEAA